MSRESVEVFEFDDGVIVYQVGRARLHYLNETALRILVLSGGERRAAAIAQSLGWAYGLAESPEKEVEAILARLAAEQLEPAGDRIPAVSGTRIGRGFEPPRIESYSIDGLDEFRPLWFLQGPPAEATSGTGSTS